MLTNVQDRSNVTEIIEEIKVAIIATKLHKKNLRQNRTTSENILYT